MDLKLLLAALFAIVPPANGTMAATAESIEVSFPNITMRTFGLGQGSVMIRAAQPHPGADVRMTFNANGLASRARVLFAGPGCVVQTNGATCHRTMDVDQENRVVAEITLRGEDMAGAGLISIAASVDGIAAKPFMSTVTVKGDPKLVLVGANIKAPSQNRVKLKVGITNAGFAPTEFPPVHPSQDSVVIYISLPAHSVAESMTGGPCFPRGPDGWKWEHPNEPSDRYACASGRIEPGGANWYEMVVKVDPRHPSGRGFITFRGGATGLEATEAIVIDTRAILPVTGPSVQGIAVAAVALIVPGVLLLFIVTRPPRRRRRPRREP